VNLPLTDRLLLGPGPSPISMRVRRAMDAAPRSHLDPDMMGLLDELRPALARVFRAGDAALTLAISGTGTSGLEAVVANLVGPGTHAIAVVNGYFGDRLAQVIERHGATVQRVEGEWGRAIDPATVERAMRANRADLVSVVHAETSTGVKNPVADIATIARRQDALTIVDAVTSLGAMPLEFDAWGIDACYSCSQKGLGAPSGMAPVAFSPRALDRRVACRSFAFDTRLLEDYWVRRKYHHTISAPLVYALHAAVSEVEDEGLDARWARHERHHHVLVEQLAAAGLSLLPPPSDRLWSLNAVTVPEGTDEASVRKRLLERHNIEIGAGLGPLAGKIWRIGLMGSGSSIENVDRVVAALKEELGRA